MSLNVVPPGKGMPFLHRHQQNDEVSFVVGGRGQFLVYAAFAHGWSIESIEPTKAEVRPDLKDLTFSEGGPKAWFVVVPRVG
jgi:oxalate decarboxylase/phosphoglucose isomerase-like protein (cupin superfamily)